MSGRGKSRFSAPGSFVPAVAEEGTCLGLVVATSRHKQTMDLGDAVAVLAVEAASYIGIGPDHDDYEVIVEFAADHIRQEPPLRWRSVTKWELEFGEHLCWSDGYCDVGDWCSEGGGRAWMDVLYAHIGPFETEVMRRYPRSDSPVEVTP